MNRKRFIRLLICFIVLIIVIVFTLSYSQDRLFVRSLPTPSDGVLQFKSGFEGTTRITGEISTVSGKDGWIEGIDGSLGDWSSLKVGNYSNLDWVVQAIGWFQGGRMEIVLDPTGLKNRVLRFRNTAVVSGVSRSQWQLNQVNYWTIDGVPNRFKQQFYRYRMYIPSDITKIISYGSRAPWYVIWESHSWNEYWSEGEQTRYAVYLQKRENSNLWYLNVQQSNPENCTDPYGISHTACKVFWDNRGVGQSIAVPFDEWFTLDVFFKYSETDGEWYVAITRDGQKRQEIAHYVGRTKYGEKLHDQMIMKMYANAAYQKALGEYSQYYDDLEIWSDYPPGYWVSPIPPTPTDTQTPTHTPTVTATETRVPTNTPESNRICLQIVCEGETCTVTACP